MAVAMAILAHCCPPPACLDKASLRQLLCRVQEARPGATTPQRALLQAINRHFLSQGRV